MKIAVTSTQASLEAQVDPRFGRCQYFVIVETDDMSFDAFENPNTSLGGGAGIQSGQFVTSKGAHVILTGNCGPNAYQTLSASGIEIIVGVSGTVREAVETYKKGGFSSVSGANVQSHFGVGGGMGAGMGGGWGMGGGLGRTRRRLLHRCREMTKWLCSNSRPRLCEIRQNRFPIESRNSRNWANGGSLYNAVVRTTSLFSM